MSSTSARILIWGTERGSASDTIRGDEKRRYRTSLWRMGEGMDLDGF